MRTLALIIVCLVANIGSLKAIRISQSRNIAYAHDIADVKLQKFQSLDIHYPTDTATKHEVFVFVYGGRWYFGDKFNYYLLGQSFAKRGIVTVIINYRQVPYVNWQEQILDAAKAIQWTKTHIADYGGNPNKLFVGGHSSGGHIAAMLCADERYFNTLKVSNPISACIQIDGAALAMGCYLKAPDYDFEQHQKNVLVFGDDLSKWHEANPINFVKNIRVPFFFLVAENTYPGLKESCNLFQQEMDKSHLAYTNYVVPNQEHVLLIYTLIFWRPYKVTTRIADYMKKFES